MSDRLKQFEHRASIARDETAPAVDVTAGVMERLQNVRPTEENLNGLLAVCGSLATVAALAAVASATWAWFAWNDPLVQIFSQAHLVMQ